MALKKIEDKTYYTYADYLEWDEDVRAEIIGGEAYMMSPPLTEHQRIAGRLYTKLASFLEGKRCEAFIAPFAVRLFPEEDGSDSTVLEPDIVVVCDPAKIDERGCKGPPDLVIEITSPSTARRDRVTKFNLYLKAKVREYWIVLPGEKGILAHIYRDGRYTAEAYGINEPEDRDFERVPDLIPVSVLPGLEIDLKSVFR